MVGAGRTLALVVGAYVLCPAAIVVMRESPRCGLGAVLVVAVSAGVAGLYDRRRRQGLHWQRITQGMCPACGYDLRATPDRCPECGATARWYRSDP